MASGGPRTGTPGNNYPNRADMTQPPAAPTGQTYGEAGTQLARQGVVPVAGAPSVGAPAGTSGGGGGISGLAPGEVPTLEDPSARVHEPITHGMSTGPGAGPEILNTATPPSPELGVLKGIYMQYAASMPAGGEHLRRIIEFAEQNM